MADLQTDLATRARYAQGAGIYRIVPAAVARPTTVIELRGALAEATARGWPVTPRGTGSAMDGSNVGSGLVLDLTALDADRLAIDPVGQRATASAAVSLARLNAEAAHHGLRMPVDPSSGRWAVLGGLVGTNAAGARTVRHGQMDRWVTALTLETDDGPLALRRGVAPDPEHPVVARFTRDVAPLLGASREAILARWPTVRKNTLGYALDRWYRSGDLVDLVVGSEGTLGIVTDVELALQPMPRVRAALRIAVPSRAMLVPIIEAVRAHDPETLELLDASFLQFVAGHRALGDLAGAAGVLLADLEGDIAAEVAVRLDAAAHAARAHGAHVEVAHDPEAIHALWAVRHGASPLLAALRDGRRSLQVIEDGCVPVARLADYLDAIDVACAEARLDVVMFGHAGDGHVHVNLLPNLGDADWLDRVRRVFDRVSAAVIALGGTPAGEHGAGRLRAGLVEATYGPETLGAFRAIKAAFDPAGRFNPGVILAAPGDPFTQLKVGPAAAPLPDGMEAWWRRVEGEALWGQAGRGG